MGRPRKYNWRKLFETCGGDSFEFTLVQDVDYSCSDLTMIQEVRNHASSQGGVRVRIWNKRAGRVTVVVNSKED